MKDEEIFDMRPGEKLDSLITEKIMEGEEASYSQNVSAAWKVVEKLNDIGWRIDIKSTKEKKVVTGVKMVNNQPVSLNYLSKNVKTNNLSESICKAALLIYTNLEKIQEIKNKK